jgi:hypothetical protein
MNRALLVAVLLSIGAPASHAAAQDYAFMGLGSSSCSKFAELMRMSPDRTESEYFDWAQGFMSGMNLIRLSSTPRIPSKNLNSMSVDAQKRYLRNYCDQHPLSDLVKGILELYDSLPLSPLPRP